MNTSHEIIKLNLDSLFADTETPATNTGFSSFNLNSLLYTNKTPQTGGFLGFGTRKPSDTKIPVSSDTKTSLQSSPAIPSSVASQKATQSAIDNKQRHNNIIEKQTKEMKLLDGSVHITSAQSTCLESTSTKDKSIPVKFIELMRILINTIRNDSTNPQNETVIKILEIMADYMFIILASLKEIRCNKPSNQGGSRNDDVSFGVGYTSNKTQ
jgi:hypothetical protein